MIRYISKYRAMDPLGLAEGEDSGDKLLNGSTYIYRN